MTEPDPVAALAAQLEDLRVELAEFRRVFAQWDAKLRTDGIGGTMTLLLGPEDRHGVCLVCVEGHRLLHF